MMIKRFDRQYLWEYDCPLEWRAMEMLTLPTMTMFCVHRVPVELEGDVSAPAFSVKCMKLHELIARI